MRDFRDPEKWKNEKNEKMNAKSQNRGKINKWCRLGGPWGKGFSGNFAILQCKKRNEGRNKTKQHEQQNETKR